MIKKHQPKGGMCCACSQPASVCKSLDFSAMKPLVVYPDGVVAVKCSSFKKDSTPSQMEQLDEQD